MTILIGILCQDGIIMGADSSATFTAGRMKTVEQKTSKICIIDNKIIIMGSGAVGLEQRFSYIVEDFYNKGNFQNKPYQEIGRELSRLTIQNFSSTGVQAGQFGALCAFPSNENKFYLCEFNTNNFQPEFKTQSIWYVSMGSGQLIADPFLGFIRRIFWGDKLPSCIEGIFYVAWALHHTIELNPGGINAPMQIAILDIPVGENTYKARLINDNELSEHIDNIRGAESHLARYKEMLQGKEEIEIPKLS
jgi:hypothetical protein